MAALLARYWPHVAIVLVVLAAVLWIDHRGYRRAEAAHELAEARAAAQTAELRRAMERALAERLAAIDRSLAEQIDGIEATQRIVQPIITREIADDPRYRDPGCAISGSVLDALNAARAGEPAAAAGEHR